MTWNRLFENPAARRDLTEREQELLCKAIMLTEGRYLGQREALFRKLGTTYRGRKLPAGFSIGPPESCIEGVCFVVYPSKGGAGTLGGMRAYVYCPVCLKEVSIGRMAQHAEVHVYGQFIGACRHKALEQVLESEKAQR